ncbi:MAG: DUF4349 domain-containing protein [Methylotenera sp.]
MKQIYLALVMQIFLVACGQQTPETAPAPASVSMGRAMPKMMADASGGAEQSLTEISEPAVTTHPERKYIALRHHLQIETPAKKMQAAFDAAVRHCEALNCQLLSAYFNKETPYSPPSASLSARIPPRNVEIFLTGLAKSGEILQHGRDSEDKTNQVVDTDARIKNLTELRDRLRLMLTDKTAKFKDIIEVERELANTQSQLDSMMSMRKILSQETDLVAVNIDFTAAQGITEQGFFAPVARALKDAGRVMMESLAAVITFVMSAIPWLLIGIPVIWLVRRYWTKIRTKLM